MEDASRMLKIPKSQCPDIWICLPRHKWSQSWSDIEDPVVPLERNFYGHPLADLLRERQFEEFRRSSFGTWMGKIPNWECLFCSPKTGTVLIGNVDDFKWVEERQQNMAPMCKKLMNMLVLTNQYVFLSICNWDALNVNVKWTRMLLINTEKCSNHEFLLPQLEKLPGWVKLRAKTVAWSYDMEGHARSAWRGIVNWQSKRHGNCTQFQRLAWMITTSRRRSWKESENHPMYALKWSWNACIRLELVDLTFFGPWTKLLARSPNGHELVTDV